ncbi:MAG: hypothetical protein ACREFQ_02115, partial [Stellaceae bacterium]
MDDEAEPVIAQSQPPVFQDPGQAAFYRPAPASQPRTVGLAALVDAGFDIKAAAEIAMALGVVP